MNIYIIQHVHFEGPGYILDWALSNGHTVNYIRLYEQAEFPAVDEVDMLVVMGGPMSVYDEDAYHWLRSEKDFIKQAIGTNKIVIGICLGSQLIAEVLGARVYPGPRKEIGWFPVHPVSAIVPDNVHSKADRKMNELALNIVNEFAPDCDVFHWHGDTFDLPKGAVRLLESEATKNQAFLYGRHVLALQFHLEVGTENILEMIEMGKAELKEEQYIQSASKIAAQSLLTASLNMKMKSVLDLLV